MQALAIAIATALLLRNIANGRADDKNEDRADIDLAFYDTKEENITEGTHDKISEVVNNKSNDTDNKELERQKLIESALKATEESLDILNSTTPRNETLIAMTTQIKNELLDIIKEGKYNTSLKSLSARRKRVNLQLTELGQIWKSMQQGRIPDKDKNRERVKNEAEIWIAKKLEEKNKIKAYLEKQHLLYNQERCPRRGVRKGKNYPCCRKCCKKSYMGCL